MSLGHDPIFRKKPTFGCSSIRGCITWPMKMVSPFRTRNLPGARRLVRPGGGRAAHSAGRGRLRPPGLAHQLTSARGFSSTLADDCPIMHADMHHANLVVLDLVGLLVIDGGGSGIGLERLGELSDLPPLRSGKPGVRVEEFADKGHGGHGRLPRQQIQQLILGDFTGDEDRPSLLTGYLEGIEAVGQDHRHLLIRPGKFGVGTDLPAVVLKLEADLGQGVAMVDVGLDQVPSPLVTVG